MYSSCASATGLSGLPLNRLRIICKVCSFGMAYLAFPVYVVYLKAGDDASAVPQLHIADLAVFADFARDFNRQTLLAACRLELPHKAACDLVHFGDCYCAAVGVAMNDSLPLVI